MGKEVRADDNRVTSGDPGELRLKAPTPDLFFREEDFLAARGSHWGPRQAWAGNLAALLTSCVTLGGLYKALSLGFLLCQGSLENGNI